MSGDDPVVQARSGEEMSAFFIGLLYFIVQWVWQMQNVKHETAIPFAYALLVAIALSGAIGAHAFLIYGRFPPGRMRFANALLFVPFIVIAIASYESAKAIATHDDPTVATHWWFVGTLSMTLVGTIVGVVPLLIGLAIRRREAASAVQPGA